MGQNLVKRETKFRQLIKQIINRTICLIHRIISLFHLKIFLFILAIVTFEVVKLKLQ